MSAPLHGRPGRVAHRAGGARVPLLGLAVFVAALLAVPGAGGRARAADAPAPGQAVGPVPAEAPFPVAIEVDAAAPGSERTPVWRFFGADEPNYACLPHGRKLMGELGALQPRQVYFRAHNLLTSGDGTPALKWGSTGAYAEDAGGKPVYDWTILDRIFDTYHDSAVRPYVEIGFMPKDLSTRPEPYQHHWSPGARYEDIYTGWAWPPKDYRKWAELVFQWARHCLDRYGRAEVETWYWEVWNEPNIGYWRGSPEEFLKLHDHAVDAVRRALPGARVGGADTAGSGGRFTRAFLDHCLHGTNAATGLPGTPLDFVSFHAKGAPVYTNGHVRMGIAAQLRTVDEGFRIVASYPELKAKPVVIGESDPEGCAACQGPQLAYRNGTMYSSYTASVFARIDELAERTGVRLEGVLTWAFEFEGQPWFAGFRSLASNGVDKPVLNVFRMFSRMSGRRLPVTSNAAPPLDSVLREGVRGKPEVSAVACLDGRTVSVLAWHYHDDDVPGPDAIVDLRVGGLPPAAGRAGVRHWQIDQDHSNAFSAWKRMGAPERPDPDACARLEQAGQLAELKTGAAAAVDAAGGTIRYRLPLPRQAVALLQFSW